jgi:dihydrofolate synthase/folylpolyglutamate synthase
MTYKQAIEFLYDLRLFGTKFGLGNSFRLTSLCGNPQNTLRFIHVAGTNGKGSTCAMLESIYRKAGLKVGIFTSPHLVSFTERMQVNRAPISEEDATRLASQMLDLLKKENNHVLNQKEWEFRPTFFEVVTVMALRYFAEKRCELVIWETGMGGRLDATNIVQPLAAVITNIQLDHQSWLGQTTEEIAREKAGIIKVGVPTVTATTDAEALDVIRKTAVERNAPLTIVDRAKIEEAARFDIGLFGKHQSVNAACALAAVRLLQDAIPVSPANIADGLREVRWPGRLQLIQHQGTAILLDGAHNPDGARALRSAIETSFSERKISLVLGLFKDKDWQEMCRDLVPLAERVFLVPVQSDRTSDPVEVARFCRELKRNVQIIASPSLEAAVQSSIDGEFVVVTGSLHLVGEAMEILGLVPSQRSERSLNEWSALNPAA